MIDIHCHILHGIDDGPKRIEVSLEMARQAVEQGFNDIIATPHHLKGKFVNPGDAVKAQVEAFNEILFAERIPLTVHPGQEVRIHGEMLEGLSDGSVLTLGGTKYILIEFPTDSIPLFTQELFFNLQMKGYIPIIAHPERNREVMRDLESLYELVDAGAFAQLTWGSYMGAIDKSIKKLSDQLIKANLVHFIATDAHSYAGRSLDMRDGLQKLRRIEGREKSNYFLNNAKALLNDKVFNPYDPIELKKRFFFF
ncbi:MULTISPECIES: tyrosine-protein phosphatase [Listeria]|uniref:tyrosine-protein phosphatase n=1 Tax=Listeria TaxID=1637 RepID=UPI000B58972F|nr:MULTISPECIES: CpsB/CapC family capsule biosynthesis tyrosine phosphatase [Listeria]